MYRQDCPKIAAHALAAPDGLVDVIAFVLSTIQTPLSRVGHCMAEIREHGAAAPALWGSKRSGYTYACEHKQVLHAAIVEASRVGDVVAAIDILTCIPSLGVVKAAFVAQLCGLDAACLDSHNLRRLGLPETALKFPKTCKPETRRAKIANYVEMCRNTGGCEYWWDSWCAHVAGNKMNKALDTAEKVSAYHVECFGLSN